MQVQERLRRRAAVISVVASLTVASAFAGSETSNVTNFQKVDDHVYRGGQAGNDGFKDLARLGIKIVVDLRQIGEHSQADEERVVTGLGMRYVSLPIPGMATPKVHHVTTLHPLLIR